MDRLIIGCGYLGIQVARLWLRQGDRVFALTRDCGQFRDRFSNPVDRQIELIEGDVTVPQNLPPLPATDTVLWGVGMDRRRYSDIFSVYVEGLKNAISQIQPPLQHFIYISSTGVYGSPPQTDTPPADHWVDEVSPTSPTREGGQACLLAEQFLSEWHRQQLGRAHLSLLRFAGIYGPGRIPQLAAVQAKDWDQLNPHGFLNLIHVIDGARIVQEIANDPASASKAETLIVSDGTPVLRKQFYQTIAELAGVGTIDWNSNLSTYPISNTKIRGDKKLRNDRLLNRLKSFQFAFADYRDGLSNAMNLTP